MTVTTHIAEILRQGIWASLTGGWYYEPTHSIFCNTVHLYLWLVLLTIPLVVGLVTSGAFSLSLLIGYTSFIGVLFSTLKAIVARLHVVFDTCEPVITTKALSVSGSREPEDEVGVEMVELREMRRRVSSDNELINHSPVMLEDNHRRVQNATEFNQLENDNEVMMQRAMNLEEDSDEDLKSKIIEVKDVAIVEKMQDNSDFNLSIVEPNNFICPSPKKGSHYSLMSRKLSEPLMAYGRRQVR